jgi:hypothetical protein
MRGFPQEVALVRAASVVSVADDDPGQHGRSPLP